MPINETHAEASSTTIDGLTLWYDAERVQVRDETRNPPPPPPPQPVALRNLTGRACALSLCFVLESRSYAGVPASE